MGLRFSGIDSHGYAGYDFTDQLQYNFKFWLDWNLLHYGAYNLYYYDSESYYNDDESRLHLIDDGRYNYGRVWEGVGQEWVWESGVSVSGDAPFRVSGVYIESDFYPSTTQGIFSHHIDYQHGRVIFDNPQNEDADIRAEFTQRAVHVGFADEIDFRNLMLEAVEEFLSDTSPSGTPSREHQIWLPSIFIEVKSGYQRGLQLGGGQIKTRNVVLHIFADNPQDRNLLMDWLDYQSRAAFYIANLNSITFPFDEYGDIVDGVTNWENMVNNYPWKKVFIQRGTSEKINSLNSQIFRAKVNYEVEVIFGGI